MKVGVQAKQGKRQSLSSRKETRQGKAAVKPKERKVSPFAIASGSGKRKTHKNGIGYTRRVRIEREELEKGEREAGERMEAEGR